MPLLMTGGGTEVQILSLGRALVSKGWRVSVICYYEWDAPVVRQFEEVGAEVRLLNLSRSLDHYGPMDALALVVVLRRLLAELKPDVFHVQYLAPALLPIIASRLAGVRAIFATSHIAGSYAYGRKAKALLRIAERLCNTFFCVSQGVERFWFGNSQVFNPATTTPGRRHYTIYNAVDVERIRKLVHPSSEPLNLRTFGPRKIVGIVGRLAEQKGHAVLLDAMKEVVRAVPDVLLLVIGDGPERSSLEQKTKSRGLREQVKWLGVRPQDEVFQLYRSMDVFAMPSLYEGFGLTAVEAMAASLPVVGTAIEGLSEVIEDGITGYLVPPGDARALGERLIELLKDPKKRERMGQAGCERAREKFGMECYRESILAAYETFTAKPTKG